MLLAEEHITDEHEKMVRKEKMDFPLEHFD
jgi:hypothetical protein